MVRNYLQFHALFKVRIAETYAVNFGDLIVELDES